MTPSRFSDWPERLDAALERARKTEFHWGEHDCCLFAADVVQAMTGHDPAAGFRGKYSDEAGAAALIAAHGSLKGLVRSVLGDPVHPSRARRGDIVLGPVPTAGGTQAGIGVCVGRQWAVPLPTGLRFLPLAAAAAAWRIG